MTSWKIHVLAGFVIALGASTAGAQSATAQAETLFRQGKDLLAHGHVAEACAAFDASQKLEPTIATLLNQASCREKNGQLATAWGLFLDAERQSRAAADEQTRKLHQVASDHAAALEPRLSTLTVTVPAENRVRGLEILRNGDAIDPGAWGKPLPVDGGTYKITARAPGNAEWSSSVTVAPERDVKTIETPKLKAALVTAPPPITPAAPASAPAHRSRLPSIVLGGSALALGGAALGFELSARSTYDKSKTPGLPLPKRTDYWESANTRRHIAQGFGIAAAASAGVAIWLYLRTPADASESRRTALHLAPLLTASQAGFALSGGF